MNEDILASQALSPATFAVTTTLCDTNAIQRKKDPNLKPDLVWKETHIEMICMYIALFFLFCSLRTFTRF